MSLAGPLPGEEDTDLPRALLSTANTGCRERHNAAVELSRENPDCSVGLPQRRDRTRHRHVGVNS